MSDAMPTSATRPLTPGQRQAVLHQGHALIEAGAGSGKTYTLVTKILYQLGAGVVEGAPPLPADARCELGEVAAITFTNAAAADLKRALRRGLRDQARATGDPLWRRRVHQVDRARIGTIHGFCGDLLREFGLRAGLDPRFRILDEGQATLLRRDAVAEELLASLRAGDAGARLLAGELGVRRARRLLDEALQQGDAAAGARARWCAGDEPDVPALGAALAALPASDQPPEPRLEEMGARLAGAVLVLAERARARMDARLSSDGALDFDALIQRTRALLAGRPDVRAALRRRLAWLFVDEFQDTDPAQKELAYLLCGLPAGEEGGAPRLCIVGDPKQSIYRFRRADVSMWSEVAADLGRLGIQPSRLETNFRSRAPLMGFVNATFAPLMGRGARTEGAGDPAAGGAYRSPAHEIAYAPLLAHRDHPGDDGLVEILPVSGGSAEERRAAEAEAIAERVLELRTRGDIIVEEGADGTTARRAPQARDFAVLMRSWAGAEQVEDALRRRGVPCFVGGSAGFFQRREVRDLRLLLDALADPNEDLALVGVLRSPFVGLTDEALLRLRVEAPSRLWRALEEGHTLPGGDGERLEDARAWLPELRHLQGRIPTAALLARALERSGYVAGLLLQPGGEAAAANVRKLVSLAEAHPEWSVRELVEYLEERTESSREPEAALHTAGEDVVTITTVHQAKGLEWPIVFLADLERPLASQRARPTLVVDADAGIALDWKGETDGGELRRPALYEALRQREEALSLAEEKRVWYVAATRARDRLVLCISAERAQAVATGRSGGGVEAPRQVADWLLAGVSAAGYADGSRAWSVAIVEAAAGRDAPAVSVPPPTPEDVADAAPDPALAARLAPVPGGHPRRVHSASELMLFRSDPAEHRRVYVHGLAPRFGAARAAHEDEEYAAAAAEDAASPEPGEGDAGEQLELLPPRVVARLTGDVLHGVLERLEVLEDLDALLGVELGGRLGEGAPEGLRRRLERELRQMVERTAGHPRVAPLLAGGSDERELSFTWLVPVDGETVAVRGSLDLAALTDAAGEVEVVDYKSNKVRPGEEATLARRYATQRDVYVAAVSALLGAPPADFTFFFAATGAPVPPEARSGPRISVRQARDAERRVRDTLRELRLAAR